jgi:hypothetical protein
MTWRPFTVTIGRSMGALAATHSPALLGHTGMWPEPSELSSSDFLISSIGPAGSKLQDKVCRR